MIVHSDLRALRDDPEPQRAAQRAMRAAAEDWCRSHQAAPVLADLAELAHGTAIEDCRALAALFAPGEAALDFVRGFVSVHTEAIVRFPLGHVALRHFTDGVLSTLLLARSGDATLTLVAIDGAGLGAQPPPTSIGFAPADHWEHVLAGAARAELVETRQGGLYRSAIGLAPGTILHRDADRQALLLQEVAGCLVSLRLQRRRSGEGPAREHALASGEVMRRAASEPEDSRIEIALALLGRMGRTDAAPAMAEIARSPGSPALRWQALRECLALDTAVGFHALAALAETAGDPLRGPAEALRHNLIAMHPRLAMVA